MKAALRVVPVIAVLALPAAVFTSPASAAEPGHDSDATVCTGSVAAPGVLSGTYDSNVVVKGVCVVNAGPAEIEGNLTVSPGSVAGSIFAMDDRTGTGSSSLSVDGNVNVQDGATLLMGCEPNESPCADDQTNTLSSHSKVEGSIYASNALAVNIHASSVGGTIYQGGGGQGSSCATPSASTSNTPSVQVWATLENSAPYSDYEDTTVGGGLYVWDLNTCWLGLARDTVGASVAVRDVQLADPDGVEIVTNTIADNLACTDNSAVWDSAEASFGQMGLYPRTPKPNTVGGERKGQCELASPSTMGGKLGPGPF